MLSMGNFITCVLRIKNPDDAVKFFNEHVQQLRKEHPETPDPEDVTRADIGWCFGEGMSIPCRQMWHAVCGAEHPTFGRMEYDPTPQESFKLGQEAMKAHFEKSRPTSWQLLMKGE